MSEEEVAVVLAEHRKEIGSLKHRMNDVEDITKSINELTLSVHELTMNMKQMLERLEKHEVQLADLEKEPMENYKSLKRAFLTAVASGIAGAFIGAILTMM